MRELIAEMLSGPMGNLTSANERVPKLSKELR